MASGDAVQQIKDRLSIVDVVAPYVELHKAGKHYKGKSPFTTEKTPSFYVSPDRGMYYCFSSSQGGDMFTFVQKMEGVDFKGALKLLADKAGVELIPEDPKKRDERETLYAILEAATKYFVTELHRSQEAESYLTDRGVNPETIIDWQIGYVPGPPKNGWRHTREYLKGKGYTDLHMKTAGLIKEAGEGKEPYDVFRDRIMFPIADPAGRVIAFSGRVLTKGSEAPKYVNSPETELFNKSEALFGYDKAKHGIRHYDFSLIVEGQFDVVLSHQAGYNNAVAVSGTALTSHHASLLQRLSNRVVLALDSDRAGIAAVKRAAELMLARGIDLKVAELPEGKDPADMIRESVSEFKKTIGKAVHVIEFLLHVIKQEVRDERAYRLRVRDEVLPYLLLIESHIDREHFMGLVAEWLHTTKEAIQLDVAQLERSREKTHKPNETNVPAESIIKGQSQRTLRSDTVLGYLLAMYELLDTKKQLIIEKELAAITGLPLAELKQTIGPEITSRLVFELEAQNDTGITPAMVQDVLSRLQEYRELYLKKQLAAVRETLKQEEQHGSVSEETLATVHHLQQLLAAPAYTEQLFDSEG